MKLIEMDDPEVFVLFYTLHLIEWFWIA